MANALERNERYEEEGRPELDRAAGGEPPSDHAHRHDRRDHEAAQVLAAHEVHDLHGEPAGDHRDEDRPEGNNQRIRRGRLRHRQGREGYGDNNSLIKLEK